MKSNNKSFKGFQQLAYTQVPDEFFDQIAPFLSESQLKVMLYIIRRTFGFKKQMDKISLSQMLEGIVTREGERLDNGVGVRKNALLKALKYLEANGYIQRLRNKTSKGGNDSTTFSLNINISKGGGYPKDTKDRYPKDTTQETVLQETVKYSSNNSNINIKVEEKKLGNTKGKGMRSMKDVLKDWKEQQGIILMERHPLTQSTKESYKKSRKASPRLVALTKELSEIFGDSQHIASNIQQMKNIRDELAKEAIGESFLVDFAYSVKGLVRENRDTIKGSMMGYYFKALRRNLYKIYLKNHE